jgi:hypothetical protein
LQSNAQVAQELEITKQEIDDECGVDLGQDGVFRISDEGLDLQVLLDEAEEDLGRFAPHGILPMQVSVAARPPSTIFPSPPPCRISLSFKNSLI